MRLTPYILIAVASVAGALAHAAEPAAENSTALHNRPFTVRCLPSVNVWVEVDDNSLPERMNAKAESRKHVLLGLVGSSPSRGESVVCSYATRNREVTTSYYMRCVSPRKEHGQRHSYACQ